jgi:stage V sporulation protein SpoVS
VVIAYRDNSGSNYGTAAVFDLDTNLRPENYIGVSSGDYSDAATATVQLIGSVNEAQSGLTVGARHFVQTDGTLATQPDFPTVYAGLAVASTKLIVKG